jgi:hypothetical protein
MKVVVLNPWKVLAAGVLSCLLIAGSVLGVLALAGVFRGEPAEAYGAAGVGAKRWYFAEGYTGPGFEEWILAYNPPADAGGSGQEMAVNILVYGPNGLVAIGGIGPLKPGQRGTLYINDVVARVGYSGDVSIVATSPSPFICERALYFDYKGKWTGGSQILGYQEGANE